MELSIFADVDLIDTVFAGANQERLQNDGVEVSEDTWVALQVEQHDDDAWELSGGRVRDISAPLAAAGISILFLSTYISDVRCFVHLSCVHSNSVIFRMTQFILVSKFII